jgi:hypothetical protein
MDFAPGDLLLFFGRDFSSRAIEFVTRGPSHVGIVCPHMFVVPPSGGGAATSRALLFESTTLCDAPCALTGKRSAGVQAHDPRARVDGYPGRVALLRLTPAWRLNHREIALLHDWLMHVASEPYDLCGALLSGTRLFKWTTLMPYPDLGSLFCSELCAAALMRLYRMPLANPSLYNPASLVRELRRCGTYGAPRPIHGESDTPARRGG